MAIASKYPSIRPSLDLNFAGSKTVDPRITFTRASTSTYFDEKGVLRTAPANTPRIDHDPATGECLGLLIEEQRTNLLTYSEQFDNAAWVKSQATVTQNAATAPDGTLTADKFLENNANNAHQLWQAGVSFTAGTTYTASFFAKAVERSSIRVLVGGTASGFSKKIDFDLLAGTTSDPTSSSITPVGNGWYRCRMTDTPTVTGLADGIPMTLRNAGAFVYQGDGTSGVYIWGAQLEVGAFPTSYIKTEATAATRAADSAVMTGANFSSWYRQDEGTFLSVGTTNQNSSLDRATAVLSDGTLANRISLSSGGNNIVWNTFIIKNNISQGTSSVSQPPKTTPAVAIAYKTNDFIGSAGGSLGSNDTIAEIPTVNQLVIGADGNKSSSANTTIKRLAYYPKRLSNTQLQALTK